MLPLARHTLLQGATAASACVGTAAATAAGTGLMGQSLAKNGFWLTPLVLGVPAVVDSIAPPSPKHAHDAHERHAAQHVHHQPQQLRGEVHLCT